MCVVVVVYICGAKDCRSKLCEEMYLNMYRLFFKSRSLNYDFTTIYTALTWFRSIIISLKMILGIRESMGRLYVNTTPFV